MIPFRWLRRVLGPAPSRKRPPRPTARPTLETLETRLTPTIRLTYGGPGTALLLTETSPGNDQITVSESSPGVMQIFLGTATFDAGSSTTGVTYVGSPETSPFAMVAIDTAGAVTSLTIDAGAGSDTLTLGLGNTAGGVVNISAGASDGGTLTTFLNPLRLPGGNLTVSGGPISVAQNTTLQTQGGNISLTGTGTASITVGVQVIGATVDSGGGNISLTGAGAGGGTRSYGVFVNGGLVTASGLGRVSLLGTGGNGTEHNHGVVLIGNSTRVRTVNGELSLTGTGQGTGQYSFGVDVVEGAIAESTGTGAVTVNGTGGTGPFAAVGVVVDGAGSRIASVNGDISITGLSRGTGTDSFGIDVERGGVVEATGTGRVTLHGTSGTGTNDHYGVLVWISGSQVKTANGDLSITGVSRGTGADNYGIDMELGGLVQAGGSGRLTMRGTAGNGTTFSIGAIFNSGSQVRSADGDLSITGFGNGTGTFGFGVEALAGAVIQSTGNGKVTVTGVGGSGQNFNYGVVIFGTGTQVRSANADVTVVGTGRGSGNRHGVSTESGALVSAGGTGRVLVGSSGELAINANATISAAGGNITVQAGGNLLVASSSVIRTTGSGTIFLQVDAGNPTPGVGAIATYAPTSLQAPAGVTVLGGPDPDAIFLDLGGSTSSLLQLLDIGSGRIATAVGVSNYFLTEGVYATNGGYDVVFDLSLARLNGVTFATSTGPNRDIVNAVLDPTGTDLRVIAGQNGGTLAQYFVGNRGVMRSLTLLGSGDPTDFFLAETAAGLPYFPGTAPATFNNTATGVHSNASSLPPGTFGINNVSVHVRGAASDALTLLLNATHGVSYFPDATRANSGNVEVGGATLLSFAGLSALSVEAAGGNLIADASLLQSTALTVSDDGIGGNRMSQVAGDGGFTRIRFSNFTSLLVRGGTGAQRLSAFPLDLLDTALRFMTLSGDNVFGNDTAADVVLALLAPAGRDISLLGGGGDDTFLVQAGSSMSPAGITVNGGTGTNSLITQDTTGGATILNHPTGTRRGVITVRYGTGPTATYVYTDIDQVTTLRNDGQYVVTPIST